MNVPERFLIRPLNGYSRSWAGWWWWLRNLPDIVRAVKAMQRNQCVSILATRSGVRQLGMEESLQIMDETRELSGANELGRKMAREFADRMKAKRADAVRHHCKPTEN